MTRTQPRKNRFFTPLVAVLLATLAWFAWDRFHGPAPVLTGEPSAPAVTATRQVYFGPPNSVAVLPFGGAASPEEAVLAEAFSTEILGLLGRIPTLQVTARTSSYFFRERQAGPRVIAELLQSRHVLDGEWAVRSEQVELTLALYDALLDREIWRKAVAGTLPELLAALSATCSEVVAELPVPPRECDRPLTEAEVSAWTHYARGLHLTDPSGEQNLAGAAEALQTALEIDPGYTAARLELAEVWLHPSWDPGGGAESVAAAREAVQHVLQAHPESARAWALLSFIRHQHDWDWAGAAAAGRRAAGLRPGDAGILSVASLALSTVGDLETAQEFLEESVRRDPFNLHSALRLGLLQEFLGDYDAALAIYRNILRMNPDYPGGHAYRARVKVLQEKLDSALHESEKEMNPFWGRYARILALSAGEELAEEAGEIAGQQSDEAQALLDDMIEEDGSAAAFQIAELLAFRNEKDRAFEWIERAYAQRDGGIASIIGNRLFENLHSDPRWTAWLQRLSLPDQPQNGG